MNNYCLTIGILLFAGNAKAQTLISQSEAFDRVAAMFEKPRDVDYTSVLSGNEVFEKKYYISA